MPDNFFLNEEVIGPLAEGENRAAPAFCLLPGNIFEHAERTADQFAFLLGLHVDHQLVLEMTVAGNLVTALDRLANGVGIEPGARRVRTDGAGRVEAVEQAHDAPDAFIAAVLTPGNAGIIDGARLQRRSLDRIRRRLALRPGFQQHRDHHGDALAVRPLEITLGHR